MKRTLALVAALTLTSAAATAKTTEAPKVAAKTSPSACSAVSTCYFQYSISASDGDYDVYYCYSNGDGSY